MSALPPGQRYLAAALTMVMSVAGAELSCPSAPTASADSSRPAAANQALAAQIGPFPGSISGRKQ